MEFEDLFKKRSQTQRLEDKELEYPEFEYVFLPDAIWQKYHSDMIPRHKSSIWLIESKLLLYLKYLLKY